jgi:uroporphyrinogen-III decarboxylase
MERLYEERLERYVTALRNGKPDMIPIRPFVAEWTARYAGYTCQDVTHDYTKAFDAVCRCAADFDWDAIVPNMVFVWTGLTQAIGLRYYGIPGIELPPDMPFQYKEPSEDAAYMRSDEYDELIRDPTAFLYNVWLPRVSVEVSSAKENTTYRNQLALVKGGMAMLQYFYAFGPQIERLRTECGTVSAIAGILKAPLDILADKLRGYIGLCMDLEERPKKVLAACEALMPHLCHVALTTADPAKQVPVGFWMHRSCVPFITPEKFESHSWATLKPIIEELWKNGHQTLFYAEGNWDRHLDSFAELPDTSIVYHVDRGDIFEVHRKIGEKFCLSGGIPNDLLAIGSPEDVKEYCRKVIDGVAGDGGYIMDAGAIMQTDSKVENLRAMTEVTREYGVYPAGGTASAAEEPGPEAGAESGEGGGMEVHPNADTPPGGCVPWAEKREEYPQIQGDETLARRIWEEIDGLGNVFIWQCLVSF